MEGKAALDVGTPVLTEQWRKRWMGAKGDEQIEIGPMIGRGGEHLGACMATARRPLDFRNRFWMVDQVLNSVPPQNLKMLTAYPLAGYGKVFKARWKSTMVAVKVVEHSHIPKSNSNSQGSGVDKSDPASAEARIAREMLLSTSISHPNVIATYKICTILVGSMLDSGFPDASEASLLDSSSLHRDKTAALVIPHWLSMLLQRQ